MKLSAVERSAANRPCSETLATNRTRRTVLDASQKSRRLHSADVTISGLKGKLSNLQLGLDQNFKIV